MPRARTVSAGRPSRAVKANISGSERTVYKATPRGIKAAQREVAAYEREQAFQAQAQSVRNKLGKPRGTSTTRA